jgi:ABC-type bacteriocin/lantibiotic exporter with double-glycine peptidase domain
MAGGLLLKQNLKTQARWFARQLRPLWKAYALSISLTVLTSMLFLLDPLLIKWLIDRVLPKKDLHLLLLAAAGFFVIYISRLGLSALAGLVGYRAVQDLVFRIRLSMLDKMNRLSAYYHETTPVGEKLYRMEQDVDQVAELGSTLVPYVLQTAANSIFVVVAMSLINFRLTCVVFPLMPLFLLFRRHFEARLPRASDIAQEQSSRESTFLQEHLASVVQVQLLRQEQHQTRTFLERAGARVKAVNDRALIETLFATCYMVIIAIGTIAILGYGGYEVFVGALTIGGLVAFYSYLARLFYPLSAAVEIYSRLNRLSTSIRRILEVIEMAPSVQQSPTAVRLLSPIRGSLEAKGVCFSYPNGLAVLQGLDLKFRAGEKVALVGLSGSGKSTIAKLIARLYDVSRGAVYIDGIDVRNLSLDSIRTNVCYLMQDAILFDQTLKENLLFGKHSATDKELRLAIEIADLEELLHRLPNGWDTPLGPRANALSGGERQRVALARGVLQNPSVFLFDESTSALDALAERRVFANLSQHFGNATFIFISHRIYALQWVDRIVVLNHGFVQEQGTHDHLVRNKSLYAQLCTTVAAPRDTQVLSEPPTKR